MLMLLVISLNAFQIQAADTVDTGVISLHIDNRPLKEALLSIEEKTKYHFFYSTKLVDGKRRISIHLDDVPVETAVRALFKDDPSITFRIRGDQIMLKKKQHAFVLKDRRVEPDAEEEDMVEESPAAPVARKKYEHYGFSVTGTVTDENATPLPGVNVLEKGTTNGTSADADGKYTLLVHDENATLLFSFIGYAGREVAVNNRTVIDVAMMPDIQALQEIVVVGYGTQKKSDVTGSIVSVNEQALKEVPVTSVTEALQGRAAGVDIQKSSGNSKPGANPVIRIRGSRSLSASNDPLFVVDGIPFNGNISDINPDDIVSVEVLKDASSTAIYGSRGANGVILISTKRGKVGAPVITYSAYTGFVKPFDKFPVMNGEEYAQLKRWAKFNGSDPGTYTGIDDPRILDDFFDPQEVESIELGRSTGWQDLVYKTGRMTNHQLGISGGSDRTQYAVSTGYFKETGIYPVQAFERGSIKLSVDHKFADRFSIGLSALNNFSVRTGESMDPMDHVLRASPLATPYDPDTGELWGYLPGGSNQVYNPLKDFVDGAIVERRKRFGTFTTLYFDAEIIPGLKYRLNAGAELKSDVYGNFYGLETTKNRDTKSSTSNRNRTESNYTIENLLVYDKVFAEKHRLNFTGLYSIQESLRTNNEFNSANGLADYIEYFNPEFSTDYTGEGGYSKWAIISYMGRINYAFNDKYLATFTLRTDGSSRLAPGNKYHTFPSAAIGWNLSEEPFLNGTTSVNHLKLRASYGTVGNAAIDPYSVQGRLSLLRYNFGESLVTGVYPTDAPNPNLEWEYTSSINAGVDFGLLQNRITGSVDVYHQFTEKLLLEQKLPPTQGIEESILANIGKTENKGIELQISTVNIPGEGRDQLRWTTDINISINRGRITQLASGVKEDVNNGWFVGHPIGTIYDYKKIGIWQNTAADTAAAQGLNLTVDGLASVIGTIRVADLSGPDGVPDNRIHGDHDRTIIGSSQPRWQGGFTSRLSYKGFDFTVVTFGRFGSTLVSRIHNSGFINTYQGHYNNLKVDYWTPENQSNEYPKPSSRFTNPLNRSTLGYYDGSYLKIRSLSLGYTLAPSVLEKIRIRSARFYATANDTFILFSPYRNKYNGLDPEAVNGDGRQQVETDTPPTYSIIFGLNLTF